MYSIGSARDASATIDMIVCELLAQNHCRTRRRISGESEHINEIAFEPESTLRGAAIPLYVRRRNRLWAILCDSRAMTDVH